jgi:hypothetical protein
MDQSGLWIAVAVVAVLVVIAIAFVMSRRRRSQAIREKFGPEYDYAVKRAGGDASRAETELRARADRVEQYHIRPLSAAERDRYAQDWRAIQSMFVDQPDVAIQRADKVIGEVMRTRGYPVGDFEQRTSDISVDHGDAVREYRIAHGLTIANERGVQNTEKQREAMLHYRNLFNELVEERRDQA